MAWTRIRARVSWGIAPSGKRQARTTMRRDVKATRRRPSRTGNSPTRSTGKQSRNRANRNRGAAISALPTVAVFGGTGFLGRNIVARLRARGLAVRVVARHLERVERIFGQPCRDLSYQAGDLLDEGSAAAAIEGAYMVVNAVSLYAERNGITFEAVHVKGAR